MVIRFEGELTGLGAIGCGDADVAAGEEGGGAAGVCVGGADWDVVQLAEVAPGELAVGVDLVAMNPVVGWCFELGGPGLRGQFTLNRLATKFARRKSVDPG